MADKKIFPAPDLFEPIEMHVEKNFTLPLASTNTLGIVRTSIDPDTNRDPVVPIVYEDYDTGSGTDPLKVKNDKNVGRVKARGMIWTDGLVFSTNEENDAVIDGSINILAPGKNLTLDSKTFSSTSDTTSITASKGGSEAISLTATGSKSNIVLGTSGVDSFVKVQDIYFNGSAISTKLTTQTLTVKTDDDSFISQSSSTTTVKNTDIFILADVGGSGSGSGNLILNSTNNTTITASGTANLVSSAASVNIAANGATSDLNLFAKRTTNITSETGSLEVYSAKDANITVGGSSNTNSNVNIWASGTGTTGGSINLYSGPKDGSSYFKQNNTVTTIQNDTVNINGKVLINGKNTINSYLKGNFSSLFCGDDGFFITHYYYVSEDFSKGVYSGSSEFNKTPGAYFPLLPSKQVFFDDSTNSPIIYSFDDLNRENFYNVKNPSTYDTLFSIRTYNQKFKFINFNYLNNKLDSGITVQAMDLYLSLKKETKITSLSSPITYRENVTIREEVRERDSQITISTLKIENPGIYRVTLNGFLKSSHPYPRTKSNLIESTEKLMVDSTLNLLKVNNVSYPITDALIDITWPLYYTLQGEDLNPPLSSDLQELYLDLRYTPETKLKNNKINVLDVISNDIDFSPRALTYDGSSIVKFVEGLYLALDTNRDYYFFNPSKLEFKSKSDDPTLLGTQKISVFNEGTYASINLDFMFEVISAGYFTLHPYLKVDSIDYPDINIGNFLGNFSIVKIG
jgi:hypothetical protein